MVTRRWGWVARSHHGATLHFGSARGCWQVAGAWFFRVFSWGICYEMVKFWGWVEFFLLKGCKFWDYNITLPKIEQIESRTAKIAWAVMLRCSMFLQKSERWMMDLWCCADGDATECLWHGVACYGDAALTLAGRCRPFRIPPSPINNLLELLIN